LDHTPLRSETFCHSEQLTILAASWAPHFILPVSAPIALDDFHEPLTSAAAINGFFSTVSWTGWDFASKNRFDSQNSVSSLSLLLVRRQLSF
jgi:hypothetical protein